MEKEKLLINGIIDKLKQEKRPYSNILEDWVLKSLHQNDYNSFYKVYGFILGLYAAGNISKSDADSSIDQFLYKFTASVLHK